MYLGTPEDWRKIKQTVQARWQAKGGKLTCKNFAFMSEVHCEDSFRMELSKCLKKGQAFIDAFLLAARGAD